MRNVILVVVALAACEDDSGPFDLHRDEDALVVPGTAYRACTAASNCVLVNVTCNGCCTEAAISTQETERFADERDSACRGYQGAICDCGRADISAACVDGICTEVPNR